MFNTVPNHRALQNWRSPSIVQTQETYRVVQKVSHNQSINKTYLIVQNPANAI